MFPWIIKVKMCRKQWDTWKQLDTVTVHHTFMSYTFHRHLRFSTIKLGHFLNRHPFRIYRITQNKRFIFYQFIHKTKRGYLNYCLVTVSYNEHESETWTIRTRTKIRNNKIIIDGPNQNDQFYTLEYKLPFFDVFKNRHKKVSSK